MEGEVNRIRFEVFGETYIIKGNTDPEHIRKIGQYLNNKLDSMQQRNPQLPPKTLLVLSAFNMADELMKLKQDYDALAKLLDIKPKRQNP